MKNLLIIIILLGSGYLQAQTYTINSFQDTYQELREYHSILLETDDSENWEKRFELDFSFPYYDQSYSHVYCNNKSICYFDESLTSAIQLLSFGYEFEALLNIDQLSSDVRYQLKEIDGQKMLIIQYTKNKLINEVSESQASNYINFQLCFYENGNIEVRFGEIQLENSSIYIPGEGFYNGNSTEPAIVGPNIGLSHPNNPNQVIGFGGTYNETQTLPNFGYLKTLPPEGWVIQFEYLLPTSTSERLKKSEVTISPNPTNQLFTIKTDNELEKIILLSSEGQIVKTYSGKERNFDLNNFPKGLYFLRIEEKTKTSIHKLIHL